MLFLVQGFGEIKDFDRLFGGEGFDEFVNFFGGGHGLFGVVIFIV